VSVPVLTRQRAKNDLSARIERSFASASEERQFAGLIGGGLYLLGAVTLPLFTVLPGVTHAHSAQILALAGLSLTWGLCSALVINWPRLAWWWDHVFTIVGLVVIALVSAASGGAQSPAWVYLFAIVFYGAYFFPPAAVAAYFAAAVLTQALPLFYDGRATHGLFLAQLAVAVPSYLVLAVAIVGGKRLMTSLRWRAERLAAEQSALRRVATAVVRGGRAERLYELVAREAGQLLDASASGILRLEGEDGVVVLGAWPDMADSPYTAGRLIPVRGGGELARAVRLRKTVRVGDHPADSAMGQLGMRASITAPVQVGVGGEIWGALIVASTEPAGFSAEDESRLKEFGDLLAAAIRSIEDREKLAAQASSDPLTGLSNHRTLQASLASEVARAVRHGSPLSVAVLDVDHFKHINDAGGHEVGDETLTAVARCLRSVARAEDTLARIGGDEFAWLLPGTTREEALGAVERARQMISDTVPRPYRISVSAGICDTTVTEDPAELLKLADGALYSSKAHGRDQAWIYDAAVVTELSAEDRAERLERSRALVGLRALARAIDAKDPAMSEHSERVAELATRLARTAGWPEERALLLGEAALVHDVGKIGVPDEILRSTGPLSDAEREQFKDHPELAARILQDVLSSEQVDWIRSQHERPDGRGYPRGLRAYEIVEGAALLAVADAWDVMTVSRPWGTPKSTDEALAECAALIGSQFTEVAVTALTRVQRGGDSAVEAAYRGILTRPV
jgi:diguanylate cyclase (GGDEF)-like protein